MGTAVYLFTHDLRLDDNPALYRASGFEQLVCAFAIDARWFQPSRYQTAPMGAHRWQFLQEALDDLDHRLEERGQHLHRLYGHPVNELGELVNRFRASTLIVSRQFGVYEKRMLADLKTVNPGLEVIEVDNHTLFEKGQGEWLTETLPKQFTPFRKMAERQPISTPLSVPVSLPPSPLYSVPRPVLPLWLPKQERLQSPFQGGESAAQTHLAEYFSSTAPSHYKQTRNALEGWEASSKFSPWLNAGCLSPGRVCKTLADYEQREGANDSTYWLLFELLWREYFLWSALRNGKQLFRFQGRAKTAPLTSFYPERFQAWCAGNTTSPLVNACMKELQATGYITNRARQIAASYLINELSIDWRYGAAWFEHWLVDYSVAVNWGNWQYIAGVGADPRGGRHFNIEKQRQQYDPENTYTRKWTTRDVPDCIDTQDPTGWPLGYDGH
ncbi:DASH family cryptochrome [Parendozoicomonas haliclonae]|uniref:Cryptochrome DASH n=1 Tax=Parendozoicomonas haliclonae TaxID=1960125 RepID=A0A1X7AKE7_9GAMM|nr:DASH family cryptochrome [Parendozoicomonas haliclonae]SMA47095.1 Cryptochrome DASH [Parendozoicomonas haliclonae]